MKYISVELRELHKLEAVEKAFNLLNGNLAGLTEPGEIRQAHKAICRAARLLRKQGAPADGWRMRQLRGIRASLEARMP